MTFVPTPPLGLVLPVLIEHPVVSSDLITGTRSASSRAARTALALLAERDPQRPTKRKQPGAGEPVAIGWRPSSSPWSRTGAALTEDSRCKLQLGEVTFLPMSPCGFLAGFHDHRAPSGYKPDENYWSRRLPSAAALALHYLDPPSTARRPEKLAAPCTASTTRGTPARCLGHCCGDRLHQGHLLPPLPKQARMFLGSRLPREQLRGEWQNVAFELDPASVPLAQVVRPAIRRLAGRDEGTPRWTLVMNDVYLQHRHDPAVATELSSVYGRWISELTLFVEALGEAGWGRPRSARQRHGSGGVLAYGRASSPTPGTSALMRTRWKTCSSTDCSDCSLLGENRSRRRPDGRRRGRPKGPPPRRRGWRLAVLARWAKCDDRRRCHCPGPCRGLSRWEREADPRATRRRPAFRWQWLAGWLSPNGIRTRVSTLRG